MHNKKDIVDRLMLKSPLHNLTSYELVEAANEITRLRKERDEARRECRLLLLGQEVLRGVRDLPAPPDDLVTIVPVPRKEDT
jgi:hypothetical protein